MITEKQKGLIATLNRLHSGDYIDDEEYFSLLELALTPSVQYIPYRDPSWSPFQPLVGTLEPKYTTTCENHEK
jgi:hypothetical protein